MVSVPDAVMIAPERGLRVEKLRIRRGRTTLIDGFSWTHRPGGIAWLTGENGAGKSSLLRVLAGRAKPTAGVVRWCGPPARLPHVLYYHPSMRLAPESLAGDWEELATTLIGPAGVHPAPAGLAPSGVPRRRRLGRVSTGEAKRLLLYALLRRSADYLFLDEPYEHLSAEARAALTETLRDRARHAVVVVATNQGIPAGVAGPCIRLDADRADIGGLEEVAS